MPSPIEIVGKKVPKFPIERYSYFGNLANTFKDQGWMPESWNNEYTDYKSGTNLLNSVELGNGKKGYVSIRGSKNGLQVAIKDNEGNIVKTIPTGNKPEDIMQYFTNQQPGTQGSPIFQRVNQIRQEQAPSSIDMLKKMFSKSQ